MILTQETNFYVQERLDSHLDWGTIHVASFKSVQDAQTYRRHHWRIGTHTRIIRREILTFEEEVL